MNQTQIFAEKLINNIEQVIVGKHNTVQYYL